ncbi:MAG: hypothetical protein R6U84_08565 [Candidatus Cloacimonadales bacterium]
MLKKSILLLLSLCYCWLLGAQPLVSGDLNTADFQLYPGQFSHIIESQLPLCDAALIIGADGTAVLIPAYAFAQARLLKEQDVWNLSSETLPPVANIRQISEIVLKQYPAPYALTLINSETTEISPFAYRLAAFDFWGVSQKNGFQTKKYKAKEDFYFWEDQQIEKAISHRGNEYQIVGSEISFEDYYFQVKSDTLKTIIYHKETNK